MTGADRVSFGAFELDLASGQLSKETDTVRLQPQPLKVLALLVSRAGQLVSREEIRKQIWPDDTFVDFDQGLNYCIRQIRLALGDSAETPQFIETVPRRGYRFRARFETRPAERIMLAVLPFENLSGDAEREYFSDGLTEEMISQLGRLNPQRLGVIARTSSMRYKRTDKSVDVIGRELGVSHLLEGSVRQSGQRVRVTAQLVHVSDQTHLWARSFERTLGDILALQSDVAHAIAAEIGVQLTPQAQVRLAEPRVLRSGAYEAYLKGRFFWKKRSREALQRSVEYYNEAIAIDPEYAAAYAGLADVELTQLDYNYMSPSAAFVLADRALQEALRLDDTLAEPHTSLGHLRLHQLDWPAAEEQFERALALNSGYDTAHYYLANLHAALGRFEDAIAEASRAVELDPMTANTRQNRIFILFLAGRYDEAIKQVKETAEMDPSHRALFYELGLLYERQGNYSEALDAFARVTTRSQTRRATVLAAVGYTQARAGMRRSAIDTLTSLEKLSVDHYVSLYDLALVHLALGAREDALTLLARAHEDHSSFVPFLNVDPRLDEVRNEPRFVALIQRMKLPLRQLR
jgi:TolB-like protein/Flp pilus assembly protein TadD